MAKLTKKQKEAHAKIDKTQSYDLAAASALVKDKVASSYAGEPSNGVKVISGAVSSGVSACFSSAQAAIRKTIETNKR